MWTLAEARSRMLGKIAGSLLTEKDAKKLKLQPMVSAPPGIALSAAGFTLPYWGQDGKQLDFFRYRYLEQPRLNGFAGLIPHKEFRYTQPAGLKPRAYFSPLYDWAALAARPAAERRYIITEGELKANCACKLELPCIGLGGVWNWKVKEGGLIDDLAAIEWAETSVYILYDSDAVSNYQIVQAENALAKELLFLGARVHVARLPALQQDRKTGLDDYLLVKKDTDLIDLLTSTKLWAAAKELHELNEEVVFVHDPGLVLEIKTLQRMAPEKFAASIFANRFWLEERIVYTGKEKKPVKQMVKKRTAKEWIGWPSRGEVVRTTYAPGQPRPTTEQAEFNTWQGWGVEYKLIVKGDVSLWRQLLDHLFTGAQPEHRHWFEQWLAYPLQNPGVKMYSAPVVWGLNQGTGKTLIGHTMAKIYGKNFGEIEKQNLLGTFNEWAVDKQFVMGDEITGDDKRDSADRMKSVITRNEIRINAKYIPSYVVRDCVNYYFTSNHPDSFFIEDEDRRYFIHKVTVGPLSEEFYRKYDAWYRSPAGMGNLFYYFLHYDLAGFNPTGHAPVTVYKLTMIDAGRSDAGAWVVMLRDTPEQVLPAGLKKRTLWTSTELFALWEMRNSNKKLTMPGLRRELERGHFNMAHKGQPVRIYTDLLVKLWCVGTPEQRSLLETATPKKIAEIYRAEREAEQAGMRKLGV